MVVVSTTLILIKDRLLFVTGQEVEQKIDSISLVSNYIQKFKP